MSVWLHLLTDCTASDVISNISGHGGPPIVTLQEFESFEATRVSSGGMVMMEFEKRFTRFGGNVSAVSEIEDTISDAPITEFGAGWRGGETLNSLRRKLHKGFIDSGRKAECFGKMKIY